MTYHQTSSDEEDRTVLNKTDARQGREPHQVRYVLGFGLTGAILALAAVLFFYAY